MMNPSHQQDIDLFWSAELALPPGFQPKAHEVHVIAQELYSGVQFFQREDWLVIAAPPQRVTPITEWVRGATVSEVFHVGFVEQMLLPDVGKIIGPAHVAYADDTQFHPSPAVSCRMLTAADGEIMHALAASLSRAELEQSGFDADEFTAFGAFADGTLCAVANYQVWEPRIAHITVATHPDHRRRGHARAAVSGLAKHAFAQGLVLQYRALAANTHSLTLGRSFGFRHYCSTIYARPAEA
jgi:GNAT superfamily N-acetyltransferase